jgi:hypothetical protein
MSMALTCLLIQCCKEKPIKRKEEKNKIIIAGTFIIKRLNKVIFEIPRLIQHIFQPSHCMIYNK